jgi:FtsP/CotA-like multicopper oxidase with cupredoxin domain
MSRIVPSSRVELWVAFRDANGRLTRPADGETAILRTAGFQTGPTGDAWPAVDLDRVKFSGSGPAKDDPETLALAPDALTFRDPQNLAKNLMAANAAVGVDPSCHALLEVIADASSSTSRPIIRMPSVSAMRNSMRKAIRSPAHSWMSNPSIPIGQPFACRSAKEIRQSTRNGELLNLAGEDHNFHIHQVKLPVLTQDEIAGSILPEGRRGSGILHDNVPLQHADGVCNFVADWRNGACTAHPVTVDIPFSIAGDFVYHCTLLEHEDGGMMVRIRVRPLN